MKLTDLHNKMHTTAFDMLTVHKINELRPCQEKAINAGILENKNMLICTPTASGKTLVAEIAMLQNICSGKGKAIYIVPLKALATEKYNSFKERYGKKLKIALSIGDTDSDEGYLAEYDIIVCTAEKLDSLLRHRAPWIQQLSCVISDEVHLINDPSRGPTLEVILTLLRHIIPNIQIIALSATIGNPTQLASWLNAKLIQDSWRPVKLKHGIYHEGTIKYIQD